MRPLVEGLLHPLLTPAHITALLGLGLLAGQQAAHVRRAALVFFAAGLLAGLLAIVLAFAVEDTDLAALLCAAIAGVLAAVARPTPLLLVALLAAIAGAAIEFDSVPEDISIRTTVLALLGTAIATQLALVLVAAIGATLTRDWQRIGVRVLGSWVAASAILVLALRLTQ